LQELPLSILAAYMATRFNNIMDMLQLIFAFVNAPLFATFLLEVLKRATGNGAFFGLISGMLAAALHHGLTLPVEPWRNQAAAGNAGPSISHGWRRISGRRSMRGRLASW